MNKIKKHIPNIITLSRLLCTGLLIYLIHKKAFIESIIILLYIFISDILDGFLARRWHAHSLIGVILDPFADKFFIISIACLFHMISQLPSLLFIILIIVKELFLVLGSLYIMYKEKRPHLRLSSQWPGKISMLVNCVYVLCIALSYFNIILCDYTFFYCCEFFILLINYYALFYYYLFIRKNLLYR